MVITYLTSGWIGASRKPIQSAIGIEWLLLTLLFEYVSGWKVLHLSEERKAADYNLRKGGLRPVGLLLMTLSPFLMERLHNRRLSEGALTTTYAAV